MRMPIQTRSWWRPAALMTALILLAGCFSRVQDTRYYLLDYVPMVSKERAARGAHPYRIRIREFSVAEAYRRNQIVYRQSSHQLRFYNFEFWAVKPEYLITDMVFRHLRDASVFEHVTRVIEQEPPHFILSGEVTAIEEYDNREQWYAHLAMSLELLDTRTQQVVWNRAWDYRKKVMQQDVVFVVRELSFLLETIVEEALEDMDKMFETWDKNGGRTTGSVIMGRRSLVTESPGREPPTDSVPGQEPGEKAPRVSPLAPPIPLDPVPESGNSPSPANYELPPPEMLP